MPDDRVSSDDEEDEGEEKGEEEEEKEEGEGEGEGGEGGESGKVEAEDDPSNTHADETATPQVRMVRKQSHESVATVCSL